MPVSNFLQGDVWILLARGQVPLSHFSGFLSSFLFLDGALVDAYFDMYKEAHWMNLVGLGVDDQACLVGVGELVFREASALFW